MQLFSQAFDKFRTWVKDHLHLGATDDDYDPYAYPEPEPPLHYRIMDSVKPKAR